MSILEKIFNTWFGKKEEEYKATVEEKEKYLDKAYPELAEYMWSDDADNLLAVRKIYESGDGQIKAFFVKCSCFCIMQLGDVVIDNNEQNFIVFKDRNIIISCYADDDTLVNTIK